MKDELKTRPCLKLFQTRMQIFLICILIKQKKKKKTVPINNYLITHFTKQTLNLNYSGTAYVECNGSVIKLPKTEKPILFTNFRFSLNGGDLVFWFSFNLAVDFRTKMALTLEILSYQITHVTSEER